MEDSRNIEKILLFGPLRKKLRLGPIEHKRDRLWMLSNFQKMAKMLLLLSVTKFASLKVELLKS